jgi:hypothetical protein
LSSLRDRTEKQFTTTGKQFRLIRPEQGIERQIDPRSNEALVTLRRYRRRLRIGRPLDEAQRWRSRGGLDRGRDEIVEVGAPWRAPIRPVYARRIVDQTGEQTEHGAACDPSVVRRTDPTIPDPIDETGQPLARIRT